MLAAGGSGVRLRLVFRRAQLQGRDRAAGRGSSGANEGCPAAIFGHCDPAGSDTLNKTLGDRRAIAIYALVTRQPDLWASVAGVTTTPSDATVSKVR